METREPESFEEFCRTNEFEHDGALWPVDANAYVDAVMELRLMLMAAPIRTGKLGRRYGMSASVTPIFG